MTFLTNRTVAIGATRVRYMGTENHRAAAEKEVAQHLGRFWEKNPKLNTALKIVTLTIGTRLRDMYYAHKAKEVVSETLKKDRAKKKIEQLPFLIARICKGHDDYSLTGWVGKDTYKPGFIPSVRANYARINALALTKIEQKSTCPLEQWRAVKQLVRQPALSPRNFASFYSKLQKEAQGEARRSLHEELNIMISANDARLGGIERKYPVLNDYARTNGVTEGVSSPEFDLIYNALCAEVDSHNLPPAQAKALSQVLQTETMAHARKVASFVTKHATNSSSIHSIEKRSNGVVHVTFTHTHQIDLPKPHTFQVQTTARVYQDGAIAFLDGGIMFEEYEKYVKNSLHPGSLPSVAEKEESTTASTTSGSTTPTSTSSS